MTRCVHLYVGVRKFQSDARWNSAGLYSTGADQSQRPIIQQWITEHLRNSRRRPIANNRNPQQKLKKSELLSTKISLRIRYLDESNWIVLPKMKQLSNACSHILDECVSFRYTYINLQTEQVFRSLKYVTNSRWTHFIAICIDYIEKEHF